jgi:tight adherence protein C
MALSILLAIVVAFGVFLVFQGFNAPQPDLLESRLAQFGDREMTLTEMELTLPFGDRFLRPILDRIGATIAKRTPANQQQAIHDKINLAGRPLGLTVGSLLALQIVLLATCVAVFYGIATLLGQSGTTVLMIVVAGGIFGYLVPTIGLDRAVKKRQKEILLALPNALDLLTISVEAGLGFDAALSRVCEKYHNALALEFSQVLNEVRLGRPRLEALDDMAKRNRVDELNGFIQAVIQSEQLGVGIANVLRIQSEEMRRRRRQRAEEQGQKAPLKMLFPMIGCIFPTLFIVLLGPAVLSVMKSFSG